MYLISVQIEKQVIYIFFTLARSVKKVLCRLLSLGRREIY